jgi:hypothetical protein
VSADPHGCQGFFHVTFARSATAETPDLVKFRLPLAAGTPPEQRCGPAMLFGLAPVQDAGEKRLARLVDEALPERFRETGRGEPSVQVGELFGLIDDLALMFEVVESKQS